MPRERTGTLQFKDGEWRVRLSVAGADGKRERPWYALGTADEAEARWRRDRLVRNIDGSEMPRTPRFEAYAEIWLEKREKSGIAMVDSETIYLRKYAYPVLAKMFLGDIRPRHVREVLDSAIALGRSRQTVLHIKATIGRLLRRAHLDELIAENPIDKVELPEMKEI